MQSLCCYRSRGARSDRNLSTPTAQLPARPARAVLPNPQGQALQHCAILPPDTQAPSLMTTPRHQAALDPTVFEAEESDSEEEFPDQRGSPTSTLGRFKSKLIRRLSHKSQSKRQSQQGISSRNEELARRAELRRLRDKRINEELESEESETTNSKLAPTRSISRSTTSELLEIPGQGPRDNIEFSVSEADDDDNGNSDRSYTPAPEMVALALPIVIASTSPRHRNSCPTTAIHSCDCPTLQAGKTVQDRGSLPEIPASPQLKPVRLSDAGAPSSIASWSLSYSAGQLIDYIGDLEIDACEQEQTIVKLPAQEPPDNPPPPKPGLGTPMVEGTEKPQLSTNYFSVNGETKATPSSMIGTGHGNKSWLVNSSIDETHFEESRHNNTSSDPYSPLDLWLRASGTLRSISHSSTRRTSDSILESRPNISTLSDLSSSINPPIIKSSSSFNSCHESGLLKTPGPFSENGLPGIEPMPDLQASKILKLCEAVSLGVEKASDVQDSSFSRYETRSISVDHIRPAFMLSFSDELKKPRAWQKDMFNKESSGHHGMIDADKSEASSYKTAPIQSSTPDTIISGKENARQLPMDSTTLSETASFKQREAELESVAKRFAGSSGWYHARSPVVSKFREEFDHSSSQPLGKTSLFAKFLPNKGKPRKTLQKEKPSPHSGHRNCLKDAIAASRITTAGPYTSPSNGRGQHFLSEEGSLGLEETATDLWQRAVRLEAERREARYLYQTKPWGSHQNPKVGASQSRNESSGGGDPVSFHARDASSVYSRSHHGDKSEFQSPRSKPVTTSHHEARMTRASSETSNRIHKEAQHQIDHEVPTVGRALSFATYIRANHKSQVIPESWAKWSSHDRAERNGATGTDDSVIPKDFAMTSNILGPEKERDVTTPVADRTMSSRQSVSAKLSKALRYSFAKFVSGLDRTYSPISNYKNRPSSSGYLEYPELELLPQHGGYKELDAIEKTIDQIKRTSVATDTRPRCLSGASSRTPLSLRFAQEIHNFQHDERSSSPNTVNFLSAAVPEDMNIPAGKQTAPRAKSAMSQQYGTPMTHISYEDCIPKHMLDENDSTKSDTTVVVKRSKSAIEHNMISLPHKCSTWNGRAKSTSMKRSTSYSSGLKDMLSVERERNMKN